jgi:F-type H+-transporting ATPase subunit epsilon
LTIPFTLITPIAVKFEGEAELVIAVGTEGETGILPHPAPYLTALRPGVLRANVIDGGQPKRLELATGEGFLQALPDRVTVLVDAAYEAHEVNIDHARQERSEAQARQSAAGSDLEAYRREQSIIDFANAQLQVAGAA